MKKNEDRHLLKQIAKGNKKAFDTIFKKYYEKLVRFALGYINDGLDAEEIVQDVMVNLWDGAGELNIKESVQAYLYASVRNKALNMLKHEKVKQEYGEKKKAEQKKQTTDTNDHVNLGYFKQQLILELEHLPPRCREIFELGKFEGLTYDEIADYLEISPRTVENQMGSALKKLREALMPYMSIIYEP